MEYAAGTVTISGRTVVVVGSIPTMAALGRAGVESLPRIEAADATITMEVDTAGAEVFIRLFSAANDFDALDELPEVDGWPAPQPTRPPLHRARRVPRPSRPRAPRLVSWLVKGRGR